MASTRPSRRHSKRVDEHGRAFSGSQLQMQIWANCRAREFSVAVLAALHLSYSPETVTWRSPVASSRFREYRDEAFLEALGLSPQAANLRRFWPKGGPVWDGLGIVQLTPSSRAVILVEGKSYPDEVRGSGCKARRGSNARKLIETSLADTATALGICLNSAWLGALYQSANRIAHVHFLRNR